MEGADLFRDTVITGYAGPWLDATIRSSRCFMPRKFWAEYADTQVHLGPVTHELALARSTADSVVVIDHGKVVESRCAGPDLHRGRDRAPAAVPVAGSLVRFVKTVQPASRQALTG
jgi:hypothetical protein